MKTCGLISLIFTASSLAAAPQTFTSQARQTSLIELYTSEGCSSCPAAERRLNALKNHSGLWTDFIPVAFHVDYWNYLGWTDPYSAADFSARQRRYTMKEWKVRTSYTPCFVVNGTPKRSPSSKGCNDKPGVLQVSLSDRTATISFTPLGPKMDFTAWIAPLSGAMTNTVTAGENRGQTLQHNFVALGLASRPMKPANGAFSAVLDIPRDSRTQAIAVWVSYRNFLKPIQATGGWLK